MTVKKAKDERREEAFYTPTRRELEPDRTRKAAAQKTFEQFKMQQFRSVDATLEDK